MTEQEELRTIFVGVEEQIREWKQKHTAETERKLKIEVESLKLEYECYKRQFKELQRTCDVKCTEMEKIVKHCESTNQKRIKDLEQQLKCCKTELATSTNEVVQLVERIKNLDYKCSDYSNQVKKLEEQLKFCDTVSLEIEGQLHTLVQENVEVKTQVLQFEERVSSLGSVSDLKKVELQNRSKNNAKLANDDVFMEQLNLFTEVSLNLQNQLKVKAEKYKFSEATTAEYTKKITELEKKLQNAEAASVKCEIQISKLEKELESSYDTVQKQKKNIVDMVKLLVLSETHPLELDHSESKCPIEVIFLKHKAEINRLQKKLQECETKELNCDEKIRVLTEEIERSRPLLREKKSEIQKEKKLRRKAEIAVLNAMKSEYISRIQSAISSSTRTLKELQIALPRLKQLLQPLVHADLYSHVSTVEVHIAKLEEIKHSIEVDFQKKIKCVENGRNLDDISLFTFPIIQEMPTVQTIYNLLVQKTSLESATEKASVNATAVSQNPMTKASPKSNVSTSSSNMPVEMKVAQTSASASPKTLSNVSSKSRGSSSSNSSWTSVDSFSAQNSTASTAKKSHLVFSTLPSASGISGAAKSTEDKSSIPNDDDDASCDTKGDYLKVLRTTKRKRILKNLKQEFPYMSDEQLLDYIHQYTSIENPIDQTVGCILTKIRLLITGQPSTIEEEIPWSTASTSAKSWSDEIDFDDECTICLNDICPSTMYKAQCGHCFHSKCIRKWLGKTRTCPICRLHLLPPDEFPALK